MRVSNFHPISLCNVVYKLASKVLANRWKHILPDIIFKTQSAFIPGRFIFDNMIVAYEALHSMKSRQQGHTDSMMVKFDISKTYDKMEWNFLELMMCKLGFNKDWISQIMTCVKTVSYLVLVNGQPGATFSPSRGLRQGDLISLYFYLICAEGLNSLLF